MVIVLPLLILYFFYLQQKIKEPRELCQKKGYWWGVYRDLVHSSGVQLLWTIWALYSVFQLERKIGPAWTLISIVAMLLLSNLIQHYSKGFLRPYLKESKRFQFLNNLTQKVAYIPSLPCDLGFLGVALALDILTIYFTTRGQLTKSWENILWMGLQLIPTMIFANVTLHGQISGFTAGVLTVFLLDYLGIGH